jgi:protein O-mannosyl-transferase
MTAGSRLLESLSRFGGLWLAAAVFLAYASTFQAGFLAYDDPWLVRDNALLTHGFFDFFTAAFSDFGLATRRTLGAEFLPLRDLLVWCEVHAFGVKPEPMHAVSVLLYASACAVMRQVILATLPSRRAAEFAAWAFALTPVHVESVAWIASQKDVLALLFGALTMREFVREAHGSTTSAVFFFAAALLSKAMSVAVLPVALALAWAGGVPVARSRVVALALVAVALTAVHVHVGRIVHMTTPLVGGSHGAAFATMGFVFVRYLRACFDPTALAMAHDVDVHPAWDPLGFLAWGCLAIPLVAGFRLRARTRAPLLGAVIFLVALAPVSQIFVGLANLMADRYLWLAVLGPWLVVADTLDRATKTTLFHTAFLVASLGLASATATRARLFGDECALWTEAVSRTERSTIAPFALGIALEEAGRANEAMESYRATLARATPRDLYARNATNNLARALVREGRLAEAEALLAERVQEFPDDPKMVGNLAKVRLKIAQGALR